MSKQQPAHKRLTRADIRLIDAALSTYGNRVDRDKMWKKIDALMKKLDTHWKPGATP